MSDNNPLALLGARLRAARHERGLTLTQAAKEMGMSHHALARSETGTSYLPNRKTIATIAEFYQLDLEELRRLIPRVDRDELEQELPPLDEQATGRPRSPVELAAALGILQVALIEPQFQPAERARIRIACDVLRWAAGLDNQFSSYLTLHLERQQADKIHDFKSEIYERTRR